MGPIEHMRIIIHAARMDNPNPLPTIGAVINVAAIPPNRHQAVANLMVKVKAVTTETMLRVLIVLMAIKRGQTPTPQTPIDTMAIVRTGQALTIVVLFRGMVPAQEDSRTVELPISADRPPLMEAIELPTRADRPPVDRIIEPLISADRLPMDQMIGLPISVVPIPVDKIIDLLTNADRLLLTQEVDLPSNVGLLLLMEAIELPTRVDRPPVVQITDLLTSADRLPVVKVGDLPTNVDQKEILLAHVEQLATSVPRGMHSAAETTLTVAIQPDHHKTQRHGNLIHAG